MGTSEDAGSQWPRVIGAITGSQKLIEASQACQCPQHPSPVPQRLGCYTPSAMGLLGCRPAVPSRSPGLAQGEKLSPVPSHLALRASLW